MANWKKIFGVSLSAAMLVTALTAGAVSADEAAPDVQKELDAKALPVNEAGLDTVVATKFIQLSDTTHSSFDGLTCDTEGNFYIGMGGQIVKFTPPSTDFEVVYDDNDESCITAVDIHKDGRIFFCDLTGGRVLAMQPDGSDVQVMAEDLPFIDDLCFDKAGNAYVTLLMGEYKTAEGSNPTGQVVKLSPDFTEREVFLDGYYGANGVAMNEDNTYLYTSEFWNNRLIRTKMNEDGTPVTFYTSAPIYSFTGSCGPDSTYVAHEGNIIQPIWTQGRYLLMDENGIPYGNVLVEDRENFMETGSVAIMPGTHTAYVSGEGEGGCAIFTFEYDGTGIESFAFQE